jgi:hypothetical protein
MEQGTRQSCLMNLCLGPMRLYFMVKNQYHIWERLY